MSRKYVFADECGNFDFSPKPSASKYFILVTATMPDCGVGNQLLDLRHDMALRGIGLDQDQFHATTDKQAVRDEVFPIVAATPLRVDAVILEKRKTYPHVRVTEERFYQTAWYMHMKHVAPKIASRGDNLLVVSASLGTAKKRQSFHAAVTSVMKQVATATTQVACWSDASHPCLQVADYCAWAIQRKWERGDTRSYDLIKHHITTEFDLFGAGNNFYY
ncbi:MAG TPA: DUF3800 domain-containing protein [Thermoanaerobaculia bacterium]|jgi:hypothetical protein|nr:DUF3800 domain-containing protein [Thermoanaerobaculia bacterium]